jgi:endogenous inhibitor of DNA gyrase (YacG/DUF329 family)
MKCPLCRQPTSWDGNLWRPFCSERCQLTDLGTWAAEEYRVPGPSLMMELPSQDPREQNEDIKRQQGD